jgi:hypothetical protein
MEKASIYWIGLSNKKLIPLRTRFCLREDALSETKKAIIIFHYAEKIKSHLIITANLLEVLNNMKNEEITSAEKLLIAYLTALTQEVNIAANASGIESFQNVNVKLEEIINYVKQRNYTNVMTLVSEAISITTTNGNKVAETLKEKSLI